MKPVQEDRNPYKHLQKGWEALKKALTKERKP